MSQGAAENLRIPELPKPIASPGQVVVRIGAAGVNPVDAGNRADPAWAGISPPYVVGCAGGGVGTNFVQLARAAGIRVAGSSTAEGHSSLRELGVEVVTDRERDDLVGSAVRGLGGPVEATEA